VNAWPADRVERRAVAGLVPAARNARTHSPQQVGQLAASIREWGWTVPVLVDEGGEIIAGHGRVLAAQLLGLGEVPVMVATGWNPSQIRAYRIADNRLALNAGWDDDLLRLEFGELTGLAADLVPLTGFTIEEIEGLTVHALDGMPELPDGPKPPFQAVTFTLHETQVGVVTEALRRAKEAGPFEEGVNANGNGNALVRVCKAYVG